MTIIDDGHQLIAKAHMTLSVTGEVIKNCLCYLYNTQTIKNKSVKK
jgi:hypothetical protein